MIFILKLRGDCMAKKAWKGIIGVILFCVTLRACGAVVFHEHVWLDATCTEPRTCVKCGETEGEPNGHKWSGGNCITPEVCLICGKEGNKKDHKWTEATCTEPERCSVCGKENRESEPLGHKWVYPTTVTPWICERCGEQQGNPISLSQFNRGCHDKYQPYPKPEQYVGISGYIAVTQYDYAYSEDEGRYKNNWMTTPWYATTYEKDKQFWVMSGTVEHKTQVVVIGQELEEERARYDGYLLVERADNHEQFYIDVADFVAEPYWENADINNLKNGNPLLAVFYQRSNYYPVDRNNRKAEIEDGTIVLVGNDNGWGGIDSETHQIGGTGKEWIYFNAKDLDIIY